MYIRHGITYIRHGWKKLGKFFTLRDIKAKITKKAASGHKDAESTLDFLSYALLE